MNEKHQDPGNVIRLDELLKPSAPEMDLNQPVEAEAPRLDVDVARSTTDPLQINFAAVDIAEKLHNSRTSTSVKIFALVFIGGPATIFGLWLIASA